MTEALKDSIAINEAQDEDAADRQRLDIIVKRVMAALEVDQAALTADDYKELISLTYHQKVLIVDALNSDTRYTTYTDRD